MPIFGTTLTIGPVSPGAPRGPDMPGVPWKQQKRTLD